MSYKVIHPFRDLQDKTKKFPNGRVYKTIGESFPATKKKISDERIKELMGSKNKIGRPLIEKKDDD